MPATLSLAVVGAQFANKKGPARNFEIALCRPGDPVELVPEPKNPKDPQAIMVVSERGVQMGYVTAERAPLVGRQMAEGEARAIFQDRTSWGAVIRVTFDGSVPVLPPPAPPKDDAPAAVADDDPPFWPDYLPPDE